MPAVRNTVVSFLLVAAAASLSSAQATQKEPAAVRRGYAPSKEFEQNIEKHMPDMNNEETKAQMTCSACAAVAEELHKRMGGVNRAAQKKGLKAAQDYEFVDVMDATCKEINTLYGFPIDNDVVTAEYWPRERAKYQIRSGWVGSFIRDRCAAITDEYDDKLFKFARKNKDLKDWTEFVCVVLDRSCTTILEQPSASSNNNNHNEAADASTSDVPKDANAAVSPSATAREQTDGQKTDAKNEETSKKVPSKLKKESAKKRNKNNKKDDSKFEL